MTLLGSTQTGLGSVPTAAGPDSPGQSIGGTLFEIYKAGLAAPAADNLFGMPSGNLRFPGYTSWGVHYDAAVEYFQDRTKVDLAAPPSYGLLSNANNLSGAGGGGNAFFWQYELNDPSWNSTFAQLNGASVPPEWLTQKIIYSKDTTQGANHAATEYARESWIANGSGPAMFPALDPAGRGMLYRHLLWNDTAAAENAVQQVSGYGQVNRLLYAIQNGAAGQWVTQWNNQAAVPAAGDGPAWLVSSDPRLGVVNTRAALQAYQVGADPVANAWGWKLFGYDGSSTVGTLLDVNSTRGLLNGATIATLDSGAQTVEAYSTAAIDLTSVSSGTQIVPARAGQIFVPVSIFFTCSTVDRKSVV